MSAPKPPDPMATANAQGKMNKDTAIAQSELNMVNQNTPYGSLNYAQTGKSASGTPQYTATQTIAPEIQGTLDRLIGNINNKPSVDMTGEGITNRQMDLYQQYLNPVWDQQQGKLDADLRNRGIFAGSKQYTEAQNLNSRNKGDNLINYLLQSRGNAMAEANNENMQPYNELNAFQGITSPNYVQTPQSNIQPPDYQGAVNANYQAKSQQYGNQMAGIFGVPTALLGGWARGGFSMSDRRLKYNIQHIGNWHNGLKIYSYTINGKREEGFLADEVEAMYPNAVIDIDGYKAVNYELAAL